MRLRQHENVFEDSFEKQLQTVRREENKLVDFARERKIKQKQV